MIELLNMDCMDYLKECDDNAFQLAIVDPPYGIGRDGGETGKNWKLYKKKKWDANSPKKDYFNNLKRVSENQIIWGGNYYPQYLTPSMGWVFWDKGQKLTMSDGELAYSSFNKALRSVVINRCEIGRGCELIHPTQKPIKLYEWLLTNYAKEGDRILDTHGGSMSSAIACHNLNYDMTIIELDEDYFKAGKERLEAHQQQLRFNM
ncbi:MAG: site-specific DNA-methyltransferase [Aureispira sp.]|nr:site-specific DNA-methyltransferase [Aureispira sp.]